MDGTENDTMPRDMDFEALLAASPNPYVVLDPALRLVWMNDAYLRVTGRRREDLVGARMFEAFPSDPESESHRLLEDSFARVLASGRPDELALIRYDLENAEGTLETRFWSATHTPLKDAAGEVAFILQHTVDVTELEGLRRMRDEAGVMRRATAVQARNLDLNEQSRRFRALVEQAPGFIAVLSGPEHRFELANRAYRRLIGRRDVIGKTLADALPEVVSQGFVRLLDQVLETGEAYLGRRVPVLIEDRHGERSERYLDFIYQPIFGDDERVSGVFVQGHDVTEEVAAAERQELLINELNHRVKNTLAVVQGLAAQSFRGLEGSQAARSIFEARLRALAAAHDLLTAGSWTAAPLAETLRSSVEATAGDLMDRVRIDGPEIDLPPQVSVSLAMIAHELSTNAIKYGALSDDRGRVEITWRVEDAEDRRQLTIEWTERDGPAVSEPTRRGFGTRLIERGMAGERNNSVSMRYESDGLKCSITACLPDAGA